MTPEDIATLFRSDVDDIDTNDPLWSDDEIFGYMDQAQKQFAREIDYFSDSSTADLVTITVTADDPLVDINPRITKIRSIRLASTGLKITPKKYDDIENESYGSNDYGNFSLAAITNWEDSVGTPRFMVTDFEKSKGRLVPIPVTSDTLNLRIYRLPLEDITPDTPTFEIEEVEYQRGLMYWMKHLAYQKNDADVNNIELSTTSLSLHNDFITRAKRDIRKIRFSSTVGTVRYGGL